jgi:hypothetical protein
MSRDSLRRWEWQSTGRTNPPFMARGVSLSLTEADEHQRTDCAGRDRCLMVAAGHGWGAFSCQSCDRYRRGHIDAPETRMAQPDGYAVPVGFETSLFPHWGVSFRSAANKINRRHARVDRALLENGRGE